MSQTKIGLQKDVSEIFNGVSPQKDAGDFSPPKDEAPAPEHQDNTAPDNTAPDNTAPDNTAPDNTAPDNITPDNSAPKQSVPSHMTPNKPKSDQPEPKKESSVKTSKADAGAKVIDKILQHPALQKIKNKLLQPKDGVSPGRQKATVLGVPILFIVLIVMFVRAFSSPSGRTAKPAPSGPTTVAAADSDTEAAWQTPEPYPTTLRDPMQFGSTTNLTGGLVIRGIVYSEDEPTAIIGNNIVHEGDKILDVTVVKINEDNVEFETNNKKWVQKVER